MRCFSFTMTMTGIVIIVEGFFMKLGANNLSFQEMLVHDSSAMIPEDSQFRSTEAESEDGLHEALGTDHFQEARFLEGKLKSLLEDLKSFTHESSLDSAGFHLSADILYYQLQSIRDLAEVSFSPLESTLQGTVLAQHRYVASVFYLLVDSAEKLDFYSAENGPAPKLVARLIILNLKLVRLFDSRGQPITGRRNYANTVASLATRRKTLGETFSGLKVSESIRRVFDFYGAQADASFNTLAQMIPHFEI